MLALAFVKSRAFADNPNDLLYPLCDFAGDLLGFRGVVLAAAGRLAGDLAGDANGSGGSGQTMSALLLRLYQKGHEGEDCQLVENCLNRWDAMLAAGVGEAQRHLDSIGG